MNQERGGIYMGKEGWEELFRQYEGSGLSVAAFCRAHGVKEDQFRYQHRIRREKGKRPEFVRVDRGASRTVEFVLRDTLTIRCPLESVAELLELLDARLQ